MADDAGVCSGPVQFVRGTREPQRRPAAQRSGLSSNGTSSIVSPPCTCRGRCAAANVAAILLTRVAQSSEHDLATCTARRRKPHHRHRATAFLRDANAGGRGELPPPVSVALTS